MQAVLCTLKALGEQREIFAMKANVEWEAVIYNIQNLQFETTELGGEGKCLSVISVSEERVVSLVPGCSIMAGRS